MPKIVNYDAVVAEAEAMGLHSLYHRSGSFGFGDGVLVQHIGWLGPPDSTLRPVANLLVRQAAEPHARRLADALAYAGAELHVTNTWLLPMSHWAYELTFGGGEWLGELLGNIGVDAESLRDRTDGSAIAFAPDELAALKLAAATLLDRLTGSDFAVLMPKTRLVGTIHHHRQIWWTTDDAGIHAKLREIGVNW
jgi:hypothetical protein